MEISEKLHTIILLIGENQTAKSLFIKKVLIPGLTKRDRRTAFQTTVECLTELEALEKLESLITFPKIPEFVIIDCKILNNNDEEKIKTIAQLFNYNLAVILMTATPPKNACRAKTKGIRVINEQVFLTNQANYRIDVTDWEAYVRCLLPESEKFIIIGDVHESLESFKALIIPKYFSEFEGKLVKTANVEVILVGDLIDKGRQTAATINFFLKNQSCFHFVLGNHERFVYQYLKGQITNANPEIMRKYFDSIPLLEQNQDLYDKFCQLYAATRPFFRRGDCFYVTHAPCRNKYVGKLGVKACKKQCRFYLNRDADFEEQLSFLQEEQCSTDPYHFFGHVAVKEPIVLGNKIGVDTGVVHGNKLTAVSVCFGEIGFESVGAKNKGIEGELFTLFCK
ncbi:MAG: metallophosphoesterase [Culicoidibacterales bacterium]